ncbi:MAG: DUF4251 domain-containing protein [Phocaeicola sp.]
MKKNLFLILLVVAAGMGLTSYAQESNSVEQQVKNAIDKKSYTIKAKQAIPQRGESRFLTSEYTLTVRNDSVFSYLPYFGVAYNIPYGGGEGLIFDAPIMKYKEKKGKKDSYLVEFETQNKEGRQVYKITIFLNGKSTVHVQPTNRQGITFYGDVALED